MATQTKKYKYTNIGLYKKPPKELEAKGVKNASLYVSLGGKKGPESITINKGDVFVFTTRMEKLKSLEQALQEGKMAEDTYNYFVNEVFSDQDIIAEVVLKQPL